MSTITYSATGLPYGLETQPDHRSDQRHSPSRRCELLQPLHVTIIASDGTYSISQSFNWTIDSPITINGLGSEEFAEGQQVDIPFQISSSLAGGLISYFASGFPSGLSLQDTALCVNLPINSILDAGPHIVTITVTDRFNGVPYNSSFPVNIEVTSRWNNAVASAACDWSSGSFRS